MENSKDKKSNKQFTQTEKAKRGWWFSVVFMVLVICLIMFLAFIPLQQDNRDIIVGMIGMITGAISSMLSIAPVELLLEGGVEVKLGIDNISDLFMPLVDGDLWFETRLLMESTRIYNAKKIIDIVT